MKYHDQIFLTLLILLLCIPTDITLAREDGKDDQLILADSLYSVGIELFSDQKIDQAREHYIQAFNVYNNNKEYGKLSDAANKIGSTYGMQGDYTQAEEYIRQGYEAALKADDPGLQGESLSNLGNVYRYQGKYTEAVGFYHDAMRIYQELGDSNQIGSIYNRLGIISDYQGNYTQSLEYYFKALKIHESTGDTSRIASVIGNIGIAYYYLKDFHKAINYTYIQLKYQQEAGNKRGESFSLNNLGQFHEELGNMDSALYYQTEGLKLKEELGLKAGIATSYQNIGNIHSKQEKFPQALEYHKKSLQIREEIKNNPGIAMSCIGIATAHTRMNEYNKAIPYAEQALIIGREIGYPEIIQAAAGILRDANAALSSYKKAFEYQTIFQEMSDSLMNAENIKKSTQLEMQYEFDKTQQELEFKQEKERLAHESALKRQKLVTWSFITGFILVALLAFFILRSYRQKKKANELLAEQKEEILTMNEQLQNSLNEKEVLLKEIHHRVKNNLQVISSLLNLQSHSLQDESIKEAVKEGQSRVKSMGLIHQTLYQSEHLSRINFEEYLQQLTAYISSSFNIAGKTINCQVKAQDVSLDIDTAIPLGLIINELLSNAYKYAFAEQDTGTIMVQVKSEGNNNYQLDISDNGTGLPVGTDPLKTESLGLRLVNILTRQLNGEIKFSGDNGTRIIITFSEMIK